MFCRVYLHHLCLVVCTCTYVHPCVLVVYVSVHHIVFVVVLVLCISQCACCCSRAVCITYLESASKSAFAENTSFSWFLLTPTSHGLTGPTSEQTHTHTHTQVQHANQHTAHTNHMTSHVINYSGVLFPTYILPVRHDNRPPHNYRGKQEVGDSTPDQ